MINKRKIILPKLYRNFILIFIGLSFISFFAILNFIKAKAIIIIVPAIEKVTTEFTIEVIEEATSTIAFDKEKAVLGIVREIVSAGSQNFPATDKRVVTNTNTVGEVTIFNNYTKAQILVASTRLLASNGTLLRLEKTVAVPPKDKIKVRVYPDKPEEFDNLAPSKFTIPGLWQPLQEKIYAESFHPFKKGEQTIYMVSENDFKEAEEKLKESLYQKAVSDFNQTISSQQALWSKLSTYKIMDKKFSHQIGEETTEFKTEITLNSIFVAFDESQVVFLAKEKLKSVTPSGKKLISLNADSLSYSVENYDLGIKKAQVKVKVEGRAKGNISNLEIRKEELTGRTLAEIRSYFANLAGVKEIKVDFFPNWRQKTPAFKDRIFIESSEE